MMAKKNKEHTNSFIYPYITMPILYTCPDYRNDKHSLTFFSVGKILWRREWQPTPVCLPGVSYGQRSLVGYNPWVRRELLMTEQLARNKNAYLKHLNKIWVLECSEQCKDMCWLNKYFQSRREKKPQVWNWNWGKRNSRDRSVADNTNSM